MSYCSFCWLASMTSRFFFTPINFDFDVDDFNCFYEFFSDFFSIFSPYILLCSLLVCGPQPIQGKKQIYQYKIMDEQKSRGKNIKMYDRIKLQHMRTGFRLHPINYSCANGSYNQAVACHKIRDQTDWFIVLRAGSSVDASHNSLFDHFKYGDQVLLSSCKVKKYLHASNDCQSEVSKNFEVSLCENGDGSPSCAEDQWTVEKSAASMDSYWRVGEVIRLKSVECEGSYLASHRRKLKESGENEVFSIKYNPQQNAEQQESNQVNNQSSMEWMVTQIDPFIYSANLTEKKPEKLSEEASELNRLKRMQEKLKKKENEANTVSQLIIHGNERLKQLEDKEKQMKGLGMQKDSWWRRVCCWCCLKGEYEKLQ